VNEMIGHSPDPRGFEARITPLNGLSNSEPNRARRRPRASRRRCAGCPASGGTARHRRIGWTGTAEIAGAAEMPVLGAAFPLPVGRAKIVVSSEGMRAKRRPSSRRHYPPRPETKPSAETPAICRAFRRSNTVIVSGESRVRGRARVVGCREWRGKNGAALACLSTVRPRCVARCAEIGLRRRGGRAGRVAAERTVHVADIPDAVLHRQQCGGLCGVVVVRAPATRD
jgi:hypothetical protein